MKRLASLLLRLSVKTPGLELIREGGDGDKSGER